MEYLEGATMILLGVMIMIFGRTTFRSAGAGPASRFALPGWLDTLLAWAIGISCIWFGASLLLGHSHFF